MRTTAHPHEIARTPAPPGWHFRPAAPSRLAGGLCVASVLVVAFLAGFHPEQLAYGIGWGVLLGSLVLPPVFVVALRIDGAGWGAALTIVSAVLLLIIVAVFIPSWYWFTYWPEQREAAAQVGRWLLVV